MDSTDRGRANGPATHFADPARADAETIAQQSRQLRADPLLAGLLDCFPVAAVAVNRHRQIVLANSKLQEMVGISPEVLIGLRPGEALDCVHAFDMPSGCGTSPACPYCGAALALVDCLATGRPQVQECRVVRRAAKGPMALDLRVTATPLDIPSGRFLIFAVEDTTDEKRRRVLERLFFHDAINVAGGLQGLTQLLAESEGEEAREIRHEVYSLSTQLVEEIQAHRDLAAAESGDLEAHLVETDVPEILARLATSYAHQPVAVDKHLEIECIDDPAPIRTDPVLLRRVLGNLLKNALEASRSEATVTVRFDRDECGAPRFEVVNPGVMPVAVRQQLFQRSYSTKDGAGRGVGSYSVKLFTERYLGGSVRFRSDDATGTVFTVTLPE